MSGTMVHWDTSNLAVHYSAAESKALTTSAYCPICFDPGDSPATYTVEFSGIRKCSDSSLWTYLNTIWSLPFYSQSGNMCLWRTEWDDGTATGAIIFWLESGYNVRIIIEQHTPAFRWAYYGVGSGGTCDTSGSGLASIYGCSGLTVGYDGVAEWCPGSNPGGCP